MRATTDSSELERGKRYMKAIARAHTNIALIKYWGKRDEELFLPMNSSLSITLDKFYTTTAVEFTEGLSEDEFILDGVKASRNETKKIGHFLDRIRKIAGSRSYARITSLNNVPTAAGFASSASGYAALAAAATKALGLNLDERDLSMVARQGSGSASRSIFGGFVEWQKGENVDGSDSYSMPILDEKEWDLSILSALLVSKPKKVSSREGMKRTVETSPFYQGWLEAVEKDLMTAKTAISRRDYELLGNVVEGNAFKMHATTLGANPPFMYWQSGTLEVIQHVQEQRSRGIQAYCTIDAGPNVKVLCQRKDEKVVSEALQSISVVKEVYQCHPGPGVSYLNDLKS